MEKTFSELEQLGLFKWLDEEHNLSNKREVTPEYLDNLPITDIHRTGINACAFRWFREKHDLQASNIMFSNGKYDTGITTYKGTQSLWGNGPIYDTPEEAELDCLKKLIEIVKS